MADVYFLLEYPIYREFDAEDIDALSGICEEKTYPDGAVIFSANSPGDAMYIIKKGTAKVFIETATRKKQVALLSEGEFFGELALIDGSPRSATVAAGGETSLIRLSNEAYKKLRTEHSSTGFKVTDVLLKYLSQRIRRTTKKAASLIKGRKKKVSKRKAAKK